jgi:hypothetical protein
VSADDVIHCLPAERCLVRDEDGAVWQWCTDGERCGWVLLLPDPAQQGPLPWDRLAPHVTEVLVPLPGLVPVKVDPGPAA